MGNGDVQAWSWELGWRWDPEGWLWALGGAQLLLDVPHGPSHPFPWLPTPAQPRRDAGSAALPCSAAVHGLSCSKPGANKPYRDICYYS